MEGLTMRNPTVESGINSNAVQERDTGMPTVSKTKGKNRLPVLETLWSYLHSPNKRGSTNMKVAQFRN